MCILSSDNGYAIHRMCVTGAGKGCFLHRSTATGTGRPSIPQQDLTRIRPSYDEVGMKGRKFRGENIGCGMESVFRAAM